MSEPTERHPTRAAVEFDGDCYGKLYLKTAPECKVCLVRKQCRRAAKSDDPDVKDLKENEMMATKKAKKEKVEKHEEADKARPLSKKYKKDKENCGFRKGSAGWAAYVTLIEECGKLFTAEELSAKTLVFCKKLNKNKDVREQYGKVTYHSDSKTPIMMRVFRDLGLIVYNGEGEYKKLV